jgi:hypothetical protein
MVTTFLSKHKRKSGLLFLLTFSSVCLFGSFSSLKETAFAEVVKIHPSRLLDRVSLSLTGNLLSSEEKQKFVNGEKDLDQFIDEMVQSDGFLSEFSAYWLTRLGITNATDFQNISAGTPAGTVLSSLTPNAGNINSRSLQYLTESKDDVSYSFYALDSHVLANLRSSNMTDAARLTLETAISQRDCRVRTEIKYTPNGTAIERKIPLVVPSNLIDINPWWNPTSTVKSCPGVKEHCGNKLENCFPAAGLTPGKAADPGYSYFSNLSKDITLEPGILIAKIVQEGRPWDDVVRSTDGVMTGVMEDFLASDWGARVMLAMPPGSYKNGSESILTRSDPNNRKWKFVSKGALHAGVLTTITFQKAFNGWRAKSNAALGAFLCRQFSVPEGTAIVPSEESDLTRRPYCSSCHSVLEPLSQFYGRWPNLGSTNFIYNPSAGVTANGSFEGMSDADTNGLGRVLSNTVDFEDCAVRSTFEFLAGREMTTNESAAYLSDWSKTYRESGKKIIPLMKKIVNSKSYKGE